MGGIVFKFVDSLISLAAGIVLIIKPEIIVSKIQKENQQNLIVVFRIIGFITLITGFITLLY